MIAQADDRAAAAVVRPHSADGERAIDRPWPECQPISTPRLSAKRWQGTPADRFATAGEFAQALKPSITTPTGASVAAARRLAVSTRAAIVIAVVGLAGAAPPSCSRVIGRPRLLSGDGRR